MAVGRSYPCGQKSALKKATTVAKDLKTRLGNLYNKINYSTFHSRYQIKSVFTASMKYDGASGTEQKERKIPG
jgi:mRNA-degrading endonuclease HigB of HigAB toxin-antitoxin module